MKIQSASFIIANLQNNDNKICGNARSAATFGRLFYAKYFYNNQQLLHNRPILKGSEIKLERKLSCVINSTPISSHLSEHSTKASHSQVLSNSVVCSMWKIQSYGPTIYFSISEATLITIPQSIMTVKNEYFFNFIYIQHCILSKLQQQCFQKTSKFNKLLTRYQVKMR